MLDNLLKTKTRTVLFLAIELLIGIAAVIIVRNAEYIHNALTRTVSYYSYIDTKTYKIKSTYFASNSWMGRRWLEKEGRYAKAMIDENISYFLRNYDLHDVDSMRLNIVIKPHLNHPEGYAYRYFKLVEVFATDRLFDYSTTMHEIAHWYDSFALSYWEEELYTLHLAKLTFDGSWLYQYRQMDKFVRFLSTWRNLNYTYCGQMYANIFESERHEDIQMQDFYPVRQKAFFRPAFLYRYGKTVSF